MQISITEEIDINIFDASKKLPNFAIENFKRLTL